ncbi:hypothetical protein BIV25_42975 [Streptomyces sp. MUSC 14]|nr:hypothetical protein BIV25_42975 [Streptomyces sp. MUSC 14]
MFDRGQGHARRPCGDFVDRRYPERAECPAGSAEGGALDVSRQSQVLGIFSSFVFSGSVMLSPYPYFTSVQARAYVHQ